jgi:hypothetical protein
MRASKYKVLVELARKAGTESLTFFRGKKTFDCKDCPVHFEYEFCKNPYEIAYNRDNETLDLLCYGAVMRFLLSEECL